MKIETIEPFIDYCRKVRARTKRVIDVVPGESFDSSPVPGKFSFADIIRHLGAIERYMYAENAHGRPSRYRGCGPELAEGRNEVLAFFDRCHEETLGILSELTPEGLVKRTTTPGGAAITVWKWLRLMPEHEIHHRGQMYTYLGLLGVEPPPIYGLTSEEVAARAADSAEGEGEGELRRLRAVRAGPRRSPGSFPTRRPHARARSSRDSSDREGS